MTTEFLFLLHSTDLPDFPVKKPSLQRDTQIFNKSSQNDPHGVKKITPFYVVLSMIKLLKMYMLSNRNSCNCYNTLIVVVDRDLEKVVEVVFDMTRRW